MMLMVGAALLHSEFLCACRASIPASTRRTCWRCRSRCPPAGTRSRPSGLPRSNELGARLCRPGSGAGGRRRSATCRWCPATTACPSTSRAAPGRTRRRAARVPAHHRRRLLQAMEIPLLRGRAVRAVRRAAGGAADPLVRATAVAARLRRTAGRTSGDRQRRVRPPLLARRRAPSAGGFVCCSVHGSRSSAWSAMSGTAGLRAARATGDLSVTYAGATVGTDRAGANQGEAPAAASLSARTGSRLDKDPAGRGDAADGRRAAAPRSDVRDSTRSCSATFSGIALLLASIGIYSVTSQGVGQRTREIGIRTALGASRADVLRLVLGRAARVTAAGIAVGLVLAYSHHRAADDAAVRHRTVDAADLRGRRRQASRRWRCSPATSRPGGRCRSIRFGRCDGIENRQLPTR